MKIADTSQSLRSRSPRRWSLGLGAAAALLAFARGASATPEYPIVLDATFGTECPQLSRCLICHTSARGGQSTAVQPFAQTLRRYGLNRGHDATALQNALALLPDTTDSDEDGTPDKDELMVCGNPSGDDLGGGPSYGCDGAQLVPSSWGDARLALAALAAAACIVRRRASRGTPTAR